MFCEVVPEFGRVPGLGDRHDAQVVLLVVGRELVQPAIDGDQVVLIDRPQDEELRRDTGFAPVFGFSLDPALDLRERRLQAQPASAASLGAVAELFHAQFALDQGARVTRRACQVAHVAEGGLALSDQ